MTYLLIGIVIIIIIGAIVSIMGSFFEWLGKVPRKIQALIFVDRNKKIYDRNKDIIQKFQSEIDGNSQSYYVENKVSDCIGEIAKKEFRPDIIPGRGDWLYKWQTRLDIPLEYL
jgi:predicted PurR-regulated permease PerM